MFEMMEAESIQVIPDGLDEMVPGPYLAAILSATDVSCLSGYDRVVVLRAHQRLVSHYSAQLYAPTWRLFLILWLKPKLILSSFMRRRQPRFVLRSA